VLHVGRVGLGSLVVLVALAVAAPQRALAQPGLLLGVTDDSLRWTQHQAPLQRALADLGVGAIRFTQQWRPGETRISPADGRGLAHAIAGARGLRIVLSVYGVKADDAPHDDRTRAQYCTYVRSIVVRFAQVRDVVVWNEANNRAFWQPQSGAPADYEALLATCYGMLHTAAPGVNVITSLAPRGTPVAAFVGAMGDAYRVSGRGVKLFDTFGQNVYPRTSGEAPSIWHQDAPDVSEGDYPRLIAALGVAFGGTPQPLPGVAGVTVWYLEDGFQTVVPHDKARAYSGHENDAHALAPVGADPGAPDQATQLADAVRLAYCQPGVGAFLNFELADETRLRGWQSGVLWADWTRKPSFAAFASVVAEASDGTLTCDEPLPAPSAPAADTLVAPVAHPVAPVSVSVDSMPLAPTVGSTVTYSVTVRNPTAERASAVLVDDLPAGVAPIAAGTRDTACALGRTITCRLGALAPGRSLRVLVVVEVVAEGAISNAFAATIGGTRETSASSLTASASAPPVQVAPPTT
jgi:uncharacterized repeat protein (TIGR01451 family)